MYVQGLNTVFEVPLHCGKITIYMTFMLFKGPGGINEMTVHINKTYANNKALAVYFSKFTLRSVDQKALVIGPPFPWIDSMNLNFLWGTGTAAISNLCCNCELKLGHMCRRPMR